MPLFLDQGSEPYKSGALRVVKTGALNADAGTPVLDVVPPDTQEIAVDVRASGASVDNVRVQVWALPFGVGSPPYLNSMGGGQGIDLPEGGQPPVTVTSASSVRFHRTWDQARGLSATDPEIIPLLGTDTEFHCCIKANVYAEDANGNVTEGIRIDTMTGPTLDLSDPRQGQRNMTIVTRATGGAVKMLMFAGSTDLEREQEVLLQVKEIPIRKLLPVERRELGELVPWMRPSRQRFSGHVVDGLEIAYGDERLPVRLAHRPLEDLIIEVGDRSGTDLDLVLCPNEPQRMMMHATLPAEDFVLRSLNVSQTENGKVVGEAHVLVLTAPRELLEQPTKYEHAGA